MTTPTINKELFLDINGIKQYVLICGTDADKPILLMVHGGNPETVYFKKYNAELEEHFLVVYWEQRGTGKSYHKTIDQESITLENHIEDAYTLTKYLQKEFHKEKIFILGHSMGSLIAIKTVEKYHDAYIAYVGVSQMTDQRKSDTLAVEYLREKATPNSDKKSLKLIEKFAHMPIEKETVLKRLHLGQKAMMKYGGFLYDTTLIGMFKLSVLPLFTSKIYSFRDIINVFKLNKYRLYLSYEYNILESIKSLKIPIYLLHGKEDYLLSYPLAKEFYENLQAPKKEFITFTHSAHMVPFEEADKFNRILIEKVLVENVDG
ncbi:MAG: alpha/beta hydrolase [Sulfurovum sp.]|nr:alpha/beta hydrolase [Sulfurovum sp.]